MCWFRMANSTGVYERVQTLSVQFQILVSNYRCYCWEGALAVLLVLVVTNDCVCGTIWLRQNCAMCWPPQSWQLAKANGGLCCFVSLLPFLLLPSGLHCKSFPAARCERSQTMPRRCSRIHCFHGFRGLSESVKVVVLFHLSSHVDWRKVYSITMCQSLLGVCASTCRHVVGRSETRSREVTKFLNTKFRKHCVVVSVESTQSQTSSSPLLHLCGR